MGRLLGEDVGAGLGDGGGGTSSKLGLMKMTQTSFCDRGTVDDWYEDVEAEDECCACARARDSASAIEHGDMG